MTGNWKAWERRIAQFFGAERTPLSGGNSKQTQSDSLHPNLFVEVKTRKNGFGLVNLWKQTKELAKKENKRPVVAVHEKGQQGFWILVHENDFDKVAEERARRSVDQHSTPE